MSATTDRVLIVEDDPIAAELLAHTCRSAGLEAIVEMDAAKVLQRLGQRPTDLIILDLFLGSMHGLDLLDQIRADERFAAVAVVVLSSSVEVADRVQAFRRGASDFVGKPFDPEELVARIEGLLRRSPQGQLTGRFENYPVEDLLQHLANGRHSGELTFGVRVRPARLRFDQGRVVAAEYGHRRGVEAVWALLETTEGAFTFRASPPTDAGQPNDGLSVQGLLIEAAWVEDELARRRNQLPPKDLVLEVLPSGHALDPECAGLPHAELTRFFAAGDRTLGQALEQLPQAPSRLEFAAACLLEAGLLGLRDGGDSPARVGAASPSEELPHRKLCLFYPPKSEDEVFSWVASAATPPGESPLRVAPWTVQLGSRRFELMPRALAMSEVDTVFSEASQAAGVIVWLSTTPTSLEIPLRLLQAAARSGWLALINASDSSAEGIGAILGRNSRWRIVDRSAGSLSTDLETILRGVWDEERGFG